MVTWIRFSSFDCVTGKCWKFSATVWPAWAGMALMQERRFTVTLACCEEKKHLLWELQILAVEKKTSPLHYNRICYSFLLPKKCVWPNNIIVMHNPKYPTDEQLRLLDISSNNNLPSVLFELESIFIFFRGTLRLFFVNYLFGEEKQILRRIFYSLRTAKNF